MLLLIYLISMAVYFLIKRLFPHFKFKIEIIFITSAFLIATAVRIYVYDIFPLLDFSFDSVGTFFAGIWNVIYTVLGTFQFEGLKDMVYPEDFAAQQIVFREYLYYASSVYAALMFLSIIAVSISYEIYSQLLIFFSLRFSKKEVFIFTELNDKTLELAISIKEKHKKKRLSYEVIFSGPTLKPFNRHDPLCMQVIKHNFLYYSHRKRVGTPLLKTLGLLKYSFDQKVSKYSIHLFAFSLIEKEEYADEVRNAEFVFNEIENLVNFTLRKCLPRYLKSVVRFYVLTKENLHYEKYEENKKQIITKLVTEHGLSSYYRTFLEKSFDVKFKEVKGKYTADEIKYFTALFQLHPINESKLTAQSFSKKRYEVYDEELLKKDLFREDECYHALFLGFGNTNKKVLEQLYIDTALVNNKLKEHRFCATVIDQDLKNRIGIYSGEKPFFIVHEHQKSDEENFRSDARALCLDQTSAAYKTYETIKNKIISKYYDVPQHSKIPSKISFPFILFKEENCKSTKFLELLDLHTGKTNSGTFHAFNTIVIALGDDEENINLANVIICDARQELLKTKQDLSHPQLIAVHIKDENNYFKLETLKRDVNKAELSNFKVIGFGKTSELYSYQNIIDEFVPRKVNHAYSFLYDYISENLKNEEELKVLDEKKKSDLSKSDFIHNLEFIVKKNNLPTSYDELMEFFFNEILTYQGKEFPWLRLAEFKKESNRQTTYYNPVVHLLNSLETFKDLEKVEYLSANEHVRWNRLHIAYGWKYVPKEQGIERYRTHDCLTDVDYVPGYKNLLDLINIALVLNLKTIVEKSHK